MAVWRGNLVRPLANVGLSALTKDMLKTNEIECEWLKTEDGGCSTEHEPNTQNK